MSAGKDAWLLVTCCAGGSMAREAGAAKGLFVQTAPTRLDEILGQWGLRASVFSTCFFSKWRRVPVSKNTATRSLQASLDAAYTRSMMTAGAIPPAAHMVIRPRLRS